MPGRAKSAAAKRLVCLQAMRENEDRAIKVYNDELAAYLAGHGAKPSYRVVAARFCLDRRLLQRHVQGTGLSRQESNAKKSHLTDAEATTLVDFTIEMAYRGFPLELRDLEQHALEVVRIRQPTFNKFGKNWAQRFMTKHGSRISTKWNTSLDSIRAKTVNPAAIQHYFDLLEKTLTENNIQPRNLYGFDESGFPLGGRKKTRG